MKMIFNNNDIGSPKGQTQSSLQKIILVSSTSKPIIKSHDLKIGRFEMKNTMNSKEYCSSCGEK